MARTPTDDSEGLERLVEGNATEAFARALERARGIPGAKKPGETNPSDRGPAPLLPKR